MLAFEYKRGPVSKLPVVKLKSGRDFSVRRGHPWVFSGAVEQIDKSIPEGACVELRASDGKSLGLAHYSLVGSIICRVLGFGENSHSEAELLKSLIAKACECRQALSLPDLRSGNETTGYRLVHGEGDGLPGLIVDRYGDKLVVQPHSFGMYRNRELIAEILREIFADKITAIFCRCERALPGERGERPNDHFLFGSAGEGEILLNGVRFKVDFEQGQKTGFFLDQRLNHQTVRTIAQGRSVLNCFCYTGAFSIAAALGGARVVHSVDASEEAVRRCSAHFELNQITAEHAEFRSDVMKYLQSSTDKYELIVLDPPAFIKHKASVDSGKKGYHAANREAIKRLAPGGFLITFSCSQLLSADEFGDIVSDALADNNRPGQIVGRLTQAPCHPNLAAHPQGNYLKGLVLRVP